MIQLKIPAVRISIRVLFALFAAQTALASLLLALQTQPGHSLVHSALVGFLAVVALVFTRLAVFPHSLAGFLDHLAGSARGLRWLNGFVLVCFFFSIAVVFGASLFEGYAQSYPASTPAVYARWLSIPGLGLALIALEAGFWTLHFLGHGAGQTAFQTSWKTGRVFLILAGVLALLVGLSGLGVRSQSTLFFGFPGAPLMEWQILLCVGLAAGMALIEAFRKDPSRPRQMDLWFFFLIWAATFLLWMSQPTHTGGYALPPRAPNQEVYPFSDAMSYDLLARSTAAGLGFMDTRIPPRPLYVTFLAGLHLLAGQDYQAVMALQSLLLALLPAGLYLIGKDLAGRPSGLALAALAALRDVNSNTAESFASNLSYSKLLLSELPTALLLVLFTWILLRWARRGLPDLLEALLAGGLAGLAVLIRTQSLVAVPLGLLILLLNQPRSWRGCLKGGLALILGLVLAISPWLGRNLQVGGGLVFDDPVSQTMVLAQRYNGIAYNNQIARQPGESDSRYTARLMGLALDGLRRDPAGIARGAAAHLVNSLADSLRVVPVRASFSSPRELLKPTRPFWETPPDSFAPAQVALLLSILALSALGMAACWRRAGWAGLLPLGLNLGYNAWSALFFASGERFILPVDWAILLYFTCGLLAAIGGLTAALRALSPNGRKWANSLADPPQPAPPSQRNYRLWQIGLAGLLCLAAGSSIPLAEHWIRPAPALVGLSRSDLIARLKSGGLDAAALDRLAAQKDMLVLQGLSAYPLYYAAGEGYPGIEKIGYAPAPQPRLVFFILASSQTFALLGLPQAPDFFPDGAQVTAIGRQQKGYVQILAALVQKNGRQALWTAPEWLAGP